MIDDDDGHDVIHAMSVVMSVVTLAAGTIAAATLSGSPVRDGGWGSAVQHRLCVLDGRGLWGAIPPGSQVRARHYDEFVRA